MAPEPIDRVFAAALASLIEEVKRDRSILAAVLCGQGSDYAAAGIPMLPVVRGDLETARQIVRYSFLLVALSLLPIFFWQWFGAVYLVSALVLGAVFCALAVRLRRDITPARAGALFHYSLLYLALLFVAAAVGAVVG